MVASDAGAGEAERTALRSEESRGVGADGDSFSATFARISLLPVRSITRALLLGCRLLPEITPPFILHEPGCSCGRDHACEACMLDAVVASAAVSHGHRHSRWLDG